MKPAKRTEKTTEQVRLFQIEDDNGVIRTCNSLGYAEMVARGLKSGSHRTRALTITSHVGGKNYRTEKSL